MNSTPDGKKVAVQKRLRLERIWQWMGDAGGSVLAVNGDESGRKVSDEDTADDANRPSDDPIGTALRTVYDEAANEKIPPDMLDLLGKLS